MSSLPAINRDRVRDVHVAVPGMADRLSGALRGAYRRDRALPDDMAALLGELDRKTSGRS